MPPSSYERGAFQADDEGSIPFTRSNKIKGYGERSSQEGGWEDHGKTKN